MFSIKTGTAIWFVVQDTNNRFFYQANRLNSTRVFDHVAKCSIPKMPVPESDPRIRLRKTAFVIYSHVDLARAKQFYLDFGMRIVEERDHGNEIFFGGYGVEPFCYVARKAAEKSTFGGAAYVVESRSELEKAEKVKGATKIERLDAPGGGEVVTLTDPVGFQVHLVHGQEEKVMAAPPQLQKLVLNFEDEKPRRGKFQRFEPGPAPVSRWGHYGVTYPEGGFEKMYEWYTTNLTLAPSDKAMRDGKPVTVFFHIDRGLEFTDHHCFFFKKAKLDQEPNVAHAAFEIHDFDTQQLGHDFLTSKGYKLCWGVGRHILGSQIFDYWFDTSNFMVEHYADGDLVNKESPVAHVKAGPQSLSVWGPPVPEVF